MATRPVWAEISRSRLRANYRRLCEAAQAANPSLGHREDTAAGYSPDHDTELVAVIKANAYGHSASICAPALVEAGAHWLGVTCTEEGVALRALCPGARILLMSGIFPGEAETVVEHRLTPFVWEPEQLGALYAAARERGLRFFAVHLEIDTGMARQGASKNRLPEMHAALKAAPALNVEALATHFSAPERLNLPDTACQMDRFTAAVGEVTAHGFVPALLHAGNTATVFDPDCIARLRQLAQTAGARLLLRPGLALYGCPPHFTPAVGVEGLQPVLALKARITSLRALETGESAGYNSTFRAARRTRLALIPAGYADGVNRLLSNRGHALVRGHRVPIAGRVSMDQTLLDVTDVPEAAHGDEAVLIGEQLGARITADEVAALCGTISYEVLCGVSARVPRIAVE